MAAFFRLARVLGLRTRLRERAEERHRVVEERAAAALLDDLARR